MSLPRTTTTATATILTGLTLALPAGAALAQSPAAPSVTAAASTTYTAAQTASFPITGKGYTAQVTITRLADTAYQVNIAGKASTTSPNVIPVSFTQGLMVPTATYPMSSGHGTMALTSTTDTFSFYSSYERNYSPIYSFSGRWSVVVTTAQTSTQAITIGGRPYTIAVKAPDVAGSADGQGRRIMVTRSFEVDHASMFSKVVVQRYFAAAKDKELGFQELQSLYTVPVYRDAFNEKYLFVTVSVGKDASPAEVLAAINAKLPHGWAKLTSTSVQSPSKAVVDRQHPVVVTTAWEVQRDKGAKPEAKGAAWGAARNVPELYTGSSNHR